MTEPRRRSVWSVLADEWDPDYPALARTREAIASSPATLVDAPQTASQAPGRPEPVEVVSEPSTEYSAPPRTSDRRRVGELVQRVRDGDLSAVELLRRLLDRA